MAKIDIKQDPDKFEDALDQHRCGALSGQVAGSHYKDMPIQPVEFIHKNGIGFIEGCVIKYVCRHRVKNGKTDIEKAIHFLEMLLELDY